MKLPFAAKVRHFLKFVAWKVTICKQNISTNIIYDAGSIQYGAIKLH